MAKKRAYNDVLSELTDVLSEREKDIDAREKKLRIAEENFEIDRSAVYGNTSPSDVLCLNIGGTKISVLRRTLTFVPGSMLASRFSGRWDDSLEKDKDGMFFIDQDFSIFEPMVSFLRNKANGNERYEMKVPIIKRRMCDFYRMVDYYGMTNGIFSTHLTIHTGSKESVDFIDPKKVNAKKWTTFQLSQEGHDRLVRSYEVTLCDVQYIQIGWKYMDLEADFSTNKNSLGVGDVDGTHALDLTKSLYLHAGTESTISGLVQTKGTVVRSEDFGRLWYVNGELVDIPQEAQEELIDYFIELDAEDGCGTHCNRERLCPLISLQGEIEITNVE
eukprot:CAMPEP_0170764660 /NCGR_PEP_ID=MMETSP0733-20121128/4142_1 /TAXON_ID=186038 /ORGANISM="Fragilariopsis kerguelensis, Strain L26-C5" /LENGTH=330 /DNA_ID=CAMNT_0011105363 /DNA_START=101 /DNA_END=1090 /DNA_ORIENTATION=+